MALYLHNIIIWAYTLTHTHTHIIYYPAYAQVHESCVCTVAYDDYCDSHLHVTTCGYVTTAIHVHCTRPGHETYNHFHFKLVSCSLCSVWMSGHVLTNPSHKEELVRMIHLLHTCTASGIWSGRVCMWCSSTVRLLSIRTWMNVKVPSVIVQA